MLYFIFLLRQLTTKFRIASIPRDRVKAVAMIQKKYGRNCQKYFYVIRKKTLSKYTLLRNIKSWNNEPPRKYLDFKIAQLIAIH